MTNEAKNEKQPSAQKQEGIRVAQLLIAGANPQGIRVPHGDARGNGGHNHMAHTIVSGIHGDLKTEIEYRPWMRHFRVTCSRKHTQQEVKNEPEVVSWKPERPYFIHEAHIGSWMPVED